MASKPLYSPADEQRLMTEIWDPALADDPLAFVMFAYPWGKAGTPLENHKGPRSWQREELEELRDHIRDNRRRIALGLEPQMFRGSTSSGRGIGKSSSVAWKTHWLMSCAIGSTTIVTANTEQQLKSRTWAELGKWITLAINGHWFDISALSLKPAGWFEEAVKRDLKIDTGYYYAQAQLWSEDNPDAFAGVHNHNGIQVIFDEASGIPKPIWTVTEGFFTEPVLHRYHHAYSNPRQNTGAFFETHHKDRAFWRTRQIDSRTVEGTDKTILQSIIDRHGDDSDEARVEVKGQFPRQGDKQLNNRETVDQATTREVEGDDGAPLLMGVDVARFGDDTSEIAFRQGRDARTIPWVSYKGLDTVQLAGRVAELADKYNPDAILVDGGGVGGGVVDQLKARRYRVIEVQFGSRADDPLAFANKRTEMWVLCRDWLARGAIPNSQELKDDLLGPEYKFVGDSSTLQLEPKEAMKKRGLASPNKGDALAITFAAKVARRDLRSRSGIGGKVRVARDVDYDPCG